MLPVPPAAELAPGDAVQVQLQVASAGNASTTVAPSRSSPARLVAAIVYVTVVPTRTWVTASSTVIASSAEPGALVHASASAITVANGVSTTPPNARLSTVQPAAPPNRSLPARNRTCTVLPAATAGVSTVCTVPVEL